MYNDHVSHTSKATHVYMPVWREVERKVEGGEGSRGGKREEEEEVVRERKSEADTVSLGLTFLAASSMASRLKTWSPVNLEETISRNCSNEYG